MGSRPARCPLPANQRTELIRALFVAHPRFALLLLGAGLAALVHAAVPALSETSASSIIKKFHREMRSERSHMSAELGQK
jgi:hypothetical protein